MKRKTKSADQLRDNMYHAADLRISFLHVCIHMLNMLFHDATHISWPYPAKSVCSYRHGPKHSCQHKLGLQLLHRRPSSNT